MECKEMNNFQKDLARQIRECGESLIKNAEYIASGIKYITELNISCDFVLDGQSISPEITITKSHIPEKTIERLDSLK